VIIDAYNPATGSVPLAYDEAQLRAQPCSPGLIVTGLAVTLIWTPSLVTATERGLRCRAGG
jgi:hypothetical protein